LAEDELTLSHQGVKCKRLTTSTGGEVLLFWPLFEAERKVAVNRAAVLRGLLAVSRK
jgi:hypothetical protein